MKKLFKNTFYIFLFLFSISACQSVKDGLKGKKKNNSDEFLVKKKNPLVLPPEFDELPVPKKNKEAEDVEEEIDLRSILTKQSKPDTSLTSENSSDSVEQSILEKIKDN